MQLAKQADTPRATSRPVRPLELRQFRYFVILAEELHFARAAERLNIGQSNLSREIRSLEHKAGLRLFYRTSRRTELSAAGEEFLDQARRVLAAEEHARLAIGEFKRSAKGRLRIGICERVACSRIGSALVDWRRTNPDVVLQIVSRSGRALLGEVEAGLLDAGITAMRINEPGMATDQLWTDAWMAAVPKDHLLASGRAIGPADLARERIAVLTPEPIGAIEQQIIERMPTDSPLFIAERPSTALALMTWVEAGCGIGLLTASQGEGVTHPNVNLRPFRHGLPPAEVRLLRSDGPISPLLSGLIERLRARFP